MPREIGTRFRLFAVRTWFLFPKRHRSSNGQRLVCVVVPHFFDALLSMIAASCLPRCYPPRHASRCRRRHDEAGVLFLDGPRRWEAASGQTKLPILTEVKVLTSQDFIVERSVTSHVRLSCFCSALSLQRLCSTKCMETVRRLGSTHALRPDRAH
jgi:hypothetical protein